MSKKGGKEGRERKATGAVREVKGERESKNRERDKCHPRCAPT